MSDELLITISGQLGDVLRALLLGCVVGLYYDCWRILRLLRDFSRTAIMIQDLLFWLTSAVFVFFATIRVNLGFVRIYFIAVIFVAWLFYYFTVGNVIMFTARKTVGSLKWLLSFIYRRVFHPVFTVFSKFFMLISQKFHKIFMHITKKSKSHKKC